MNNMIQCYKTQAEREDNINKEMKTIPSWILKFKKITNILLWIFFFGTMILISITQNLLTLIPLGITLILVIINLYLTLEYE